MQTKFCGSSPTPHERLNRPVLSNLSIKTVEKSGSVHSSNLCPRSDRDTTGEGERERDGEREREREWRSLW